MSAGPPDRNWAELMQDSRAPALRRLPSPPPGALAALAIAAVVLSVVFGAAAWLAKQTEHHSWAGGLPPRQVRLTEGDTYRISTPGGRAALGGTGVLNVAPSCTYVVSGESARHLPVSAPADPTKPTNEIGVFVSPVSGPVGITCAGVALVYVDDADNAGFDWATLFVLLTSVTLLIAVSAGLGLVPTEPRRAGVR